MDREICILDRGYKTYSYEKKAFTKSGFTLKIYDGPKDDNAKKIRFAKNAEAILVRWTPIGKNELAEMPGLKAIVRYGTGYDNIDIGACTRRGVKVANVTGYGNHSVSNHAIALMYACGRDLIRGVIGFRDIFGKPPEEKLIDFHEKTLGIIGLGRIGGTLATKVRYLFREVIAADPYIEDERFERFGVKKVSLEQLMKMSDVISIHCNLTEETTRMINEKMFSLAKDELILINTARGPVIDTKSLLNVLNTGKILRAGLDVFDSDNPDLILTELTDHPKVIATGHYAWYSLLSHRELQRIATENMLGLLNGEEVDDCLNCSLI